MVGRWNLTPVEPGGPLSSENRIVAANRVEGVVAPLQLDPLVHRLPVSRFVRSDQSQSTDDLN